MIIPGTEANFSTLLFQPFHRRSATHYFEKPSLTSSSSYVEISIGYGEEASDWDWDNVIQRSVRYMFTCHVRSIVNGRIMLEFLLKCTVRVKLLHWRSRQLSACRPAAVSYYSLFTSHLCHAAEMSISIPSSVRRLCSPMPYTLCLRKKGANFSQL